VVNKADTTTNVTSSLNPSIFGQSVTFTATIMGGGAIVAEGSVTFKEGTTVLAGPVPVGVDGKASFTTSTLIAGSHTVTAEYSGSSNFNPSTGSVNQTVNKADTTTTVASSLNPSMFRQSVTFTATVVAGTMAMTEGTVTFKEGGTVLAGPIPVD